MPRPRKPGRVVGKQNAKLTLAAIKRELRELQIYFDKEAKKKGDKGETGETPPFVVPLGPGCSPFMENCPKRHFFQLKKMGRGTNPIK